MPLFDPSQNSNPQAFVGSPPAGNLNPVPDQEYMKLFWTLTQGTAKIDDDSEKLIQDLALQKGSALTYLVKTLTYNADPTDPDSVAEIDNNRLLAGFKDETPDDTRKSFDGVPMGVICPPSFDLIPTPFYSPTFPANFNHLKDDGLDRTKYCYIWELDDKADKDVKKHARISIGALVLDSLPRDSTVTRVVFMNPPTNEKVFYGEQADQAEDEEVAADLQQMVNAEVNAFTLRITVVPGTADGLPLEPPLDKPKAPTVSNPPPWRIKLTFGEVVVTIDERKLDTVAVAIGARRPVDVPITFRQAVAKIEAVNNQPFGITFIPVWNGLVVADYLPGSGATGNASYIPWDDTADIYSQLEDLLDEASQDKLPRFGPNRAKLTPDSLQVDPDDGYRLDTGTKLSVEYQRCGGRIKFVPVYFTRQLRTTLLLPGEKNPGSGEVPDGAPDKAFVFGDLPDVTNYTAVPAYYIPPEAEVDGTLVLKNLSPGSSPRWGVGIAIEAANWGVRRPTELWGVFVYGTRPPVEGFRNADGVLPDNCIPPDKILTVSVNRSLDGSEGTIVWDRYSPAEGSGEGLIDRPQQAVGAVRIALGGGLNTTQDVVMTGIAVGNDERDDPGSNTISVPIRGREVKIRAEDDGIRLLTSPFYDGFDHRDVLQSLCDYAGVPFQSYASAYKLPTGSIAHPVYNFPANTAVWDAISQIAEAAMTVVFFDRFGTLRQYDAGQTSGINWTYTDPQLLNYSDKPDLLSIHTLVYVLGLAQTKPIDVKKFIKDGTVDPSSLQMKAFYARPQTDVTFGWDKMFLYVFQGVMSEAELRRAAARIVFGVSRATATASVSIPGNGSIELLDTFNNGWVITRIAQNLSQDKSWVTELGLELRVDVGGSVDPKTLKDLPLLGSDPGSGDGVAPPQTVGEAPTGQGLGGGTEGGLGHGLPIGFGRG